MEQLNMHSIIALRSYSGKSVCTIGIDDVTMKQNDSQHCKDVCTSVTVSPMHA